MRGMFRPFELLQQPRLRKQQRLKPLLSLSFLQRRCNFLIPAFAKLGVFDLIRD
jgi:hypothetical protein